MRCTQRNCKNVRDVDPIRKLCPPCDAWMKEHMKRLSREEIQNQIPNPDNPAPIPNLTAQSMNTPSSTGTAGASTPPPIDIESIQNTYNQLKNSSTESPTTLNMFALMLNIY